MNKYWFRKRRGLFTKDLGYGWIPISWEGWVVILIFSCLIGLSGYYFDIFNNNITIKQGVSFLVAIIVLLSIAAWISSKKARKNETRN